MEDRRRRRVAFEETAWDLLRYVENSEELNVSVTELQEQLGESEEAGISVKQVRTAIFFEIFRQGEEEVCIASWARCDAQLKGLAELGKRVRI